MRMKSITGLAAAVVLGTIFAAVVQSTQRDGGHGRLLAQEDVAEKTTQEPRREDDGDQESDRSSPVWNQPRSTADILGMDILSAAEEKIGEVKDTIIDMKSGRVLAVVVSTGGLLDMDRQLSLISPRDLRFDSDGENLRSDLRREQVRSAPSLTGDDVANFEGVSQIGGARSESTDSEAQEREWQRDGNQTSGTDPGEEQPVSDSESSTLGSPDREKDGENPQSLADGTDGRSASSGQSIMVSELLGMKLENPEGESIGAVENIYLDLEQGVAIGVVVSTGGFLGLGDRKSLLGLNELEYNNDVETLIVSLDREQLERVPEYKETEQAAFDALRERLD